MTSRRERAEADARCAYMGAGWVGDHYRLSGVVAAEVVAAARKKAGPAKCAALDRAKRRADLSAALQNAEGKWPGVLEAIRGEAHRRVAERYKVDRGSIWWVRQRLHELSTLTEQSVEATVRAILKDI